MRIERAMYEQNITHGGRVRLSLHPTALLALLERLITGPFELAIDYVRIPGVTIPEASSLPTSYCIKGGGARMALARVLSMNEEPMLRDLDLFRISTRWHPLDVDLAERFMPDDLKNGHGVELVPSIEAYLVTRDLTVNQVALVDSTLICSPLAILDFACRVIRPARYYPGTLHRPLALQGRVLAKMFRLRAERGDGWKIVGIPPESSMSSFDIALHLDRALGRGRGVAIRYLQELISGGFIFPWATDGEELLVEVIEELSQDLEEGIAFFSNF